MNNKTVLIDKSKSNKLEKNNKTQESNEIINTTCKLLKNKGIIVNDNEDFVINSFLKKVFSLYSKIELNKMKINKLNLNIKDNKQYD